MRQGFRVQGFRVKGFRAVGALGVSDGLGFGVQRLGFD